MSNVNQAFGMIPRYRLDGQPYVGSGNACYVPSSDSTALFIGDPVVLVEGNNTVAVTDTSGGYAVGASGMKVGQLPTVTIATAGDGNKIYGVVVRVAASATAGYTGPSYRPASTAAVVYVETDPNVLYEVQVNGAFAAASGGKNGNLTSGSGSTVTGLSGWTMHTTTSTTNTNQLLVYGIAGNPLDSDVSANYANVYVRINNSQIYTVTITGA